jgi:hypothetical protein
MKKALAIFAIFYFFIGPAAAQNYQFTKSSTPYADLVSATTISAPGWDDDAYAANLPFSFKIYGTSFTSFDIESDAGISAAAGEVIILDADLEDKGGSVISYKTDGTAPNRIFKIEWKNVGFLDGLSSDFANFQLWLYEGSNKIEAHYGAITADASAFDPDPGPGVWIQNGVSSIELSGSPANPTVTHNSTTSPTLSGLPASGTVYSFTPGVAAGIADAPIAFRIAGPNPFNSVVIIEINEPGVVCNIKIYDLQGRLLLQENIISQAVHAVNTAGLPQGIYYMQLDNGRSTLHKKMIKQ